MEKSDNNDPKWALVDQLSRIPGGHRIKARNMAEILNTEEDPDPKSLMAPHKFDDFKMKKSKEFFDIATPLFNLRGFQNLKDSILSSEEYVKYNSISPELRTKLLSTLHQTGHLGAVRMATILSQSGITWKNRNMEISETVQKCDTCNIYKRSNNQLNVRSMVMNDKRPKKSIAIDITSIGQPSILNILVTIDLITGFVAAIRVPGQLNSKNVAFVLVLFLLSPFCKGQDIFIGGI